MTGEERVLARQCAPSRPLPGVGWKPRWRADLPVERLSDAAAIVFDAEVQSRVEARLRRTNLGAVLAARGVTTVELDEQGKLIEYRPEGT